MAQSSVRSRNTWDQILGEVRKTVPPDHFDAWLRPTRQKGLDADGTLTVLAPSAEFQERFGPQIEQAIHRLRLNDTVRKLAVVEQQQARLDFGPLPTAPSGRATGPQAAETRESSLNPGYTFTTFVVGASNRFAHAAAQAVADRPGRAYNPLYLYGGVGMGKTHLMQAVGHRALASGARLRVEYVTAERFSNEFISSVRNEQMIGFRERYRSVDVLLIDDIQFIANKERSQEEFFHTFNALHGTDKQIVISSDRPARELQLEERLRSRFESGLATDLQPPDLETRIAILIQKAQIELSKHPSTPELSTEVAEFIAARIKSNIRELEGALVRLLAYCSLKSLPVTVTTAHEALRALLDQQARKLDLEIIAKAVAESFNMRVADLKARNNSKQIVFPRQVAMFLSKQLLTASLPEIARFYGGKHHSTVIHSIRKIEQERQTNQALQRTLNRLSEQLS